MLEPSPPLDEPSSPPRPGLALPLAIFYNPARAFGLIAESREWLPAYILLVGMDLAALLLCAPALDHVVHLQVRATASAELRAIVARWFELQAAWTIVGPLVLWGFVAALMTAIAAVVRGAPQQFSVYFSLCMNCALPAQAGAIIEAAATRLSSPSVFRTFNDINTALPLSLAALRPHGSLPEITFLSYWDVFTLWSLVLLGCGYAVIAKVRLVPALLLALGVGVAIALAEVSGAS